MPHDTKKTIIRPIIFLSVWFACGSVLSVEAASLKQKVKEGSRLYSQGDYAASEEKFMDALMQDPESEIVNFNVGTALYKNGDYEKAVDHYQKVFLSEDDQLKQKSFYNLGNTLYKLGMGQEKENNIPSAVTSLEKSLKQYERALTIDQTDEDAKHNYNFVKNELVRLQQIQQQPQQQKGQGDQSDQSSQQQEQGGQSQEQQSQEGQQQTQGEQDQQQELGDGENQVQQQQQQAQGEQGNEDDPDQQKAGAQPQNASELTEQEARMLLESYQQAEEPQGPLNMQQSSVDPRPVSKDW